MPSIFERILVPVDFAEASEAHIEAGFAMPIGEGLHIELSPASVQAVKLAAQFVGDSGRMRIVHATPPLDRAPVYGGAAGLARLSGAIEEIREGSKAIALEAMQKLAAEHCPGVHASYYASAAHPVDLILAEAREFEAQAIVLAASGRSGVARFFLGSTADRIIRHAECPVMVIPAHAAD